jgi:dipeptidyl aminopeptidase/acylaminoacyl peptidase
MISARRTGRLLIFCVSYFCLVPCCRKATGNGESSKQKTFEVPCVDTAVLNELTSHYPVPLNLSPDGTQILVRTVISYGSPFGVSVLDRTSGRTTYSLTWPEPVLRLEWRPDSSEIAFFSMRGFEPGRDLYIWNLRQNHVRHVNTPPTSAEAQVRWAPNGQLLAFSDPRQGLVVVDTSGGGRSLAFAGGVAVFDWLPDSSTIAMVDQSDLNRLALIVITTGQVRSQVIEGQIKILDVAASPNRSSLLLVESTSAGLWRLEEVDTRTFKRSIVTRSWSRIGSPTWLPNGRRFCFQRFDKNSVKLIVNDRTSRRSIELKDLGGINDIRGTLPDSNTVVVAHRGHGPVALFSLSLTGNQPMVVYSSNSRSLPLVRAVSAFAVAEDGARVPLLVWRAPLALGEPTVVIRVHGGGGAAQLPVWEEHIQLFVKHGFHFVGVNYRSEAASDQQRRDDVLAAIEYAHRTLRVAYDRIVILGHSSGAGLAAAACVARPDRCGVLVLVAFGKVEDALLSKQPRQQHVRLILFYPAYDSTPRFAVVENLKTAFGDRILEDPRTSLYQFPDDHNLMYPKSWAAVYSAILAQFHSGSCVVKSTKS